MDQLFSAENVRSLKPSSRTRGSRASTHRRWCRDRRIWSPTSARLGRCRQCRRRFARQTNAPHPTIEAALANLARFPRAWRRPPIALDACRAQRARTVAFTFQSLPEFERLLRESREAARDFRDLSRSLEAESLAAAVRAELARRRGAAVKRLLCAVSTLSLAGCGGSLFKSKAPPRRCTCCRRRRGARGRRDIGGPRRARPRVRTGLDTTASRRCTPTGVWIISPARAGADRSMRWCRISRFRISRPRQAAQCPCRDPPPSAAATGWKSTSRTFRPNIPPTRARRQRCTDDPRAPARARRQLRRPAHPRHSSRPTIGSLRRTTA